MVWMRKMFVRFCTTPCHCQVGAVQRTNKPAIIQLTGGKLSIPSCFGRLYIIYSNIIKPGASMVAHPILPGILKRDGLDVLPIG